MLNVSQVFNPSGEVGQWISASTTNFTGDLGLSILILLGFVLLIGAILKMPQLLIIVAIFPLLLVFSTIGSGGLYIGIAVLILAFGLFALFPSK